MTRQRPTPAPTSGSPNRDTIVEGLTGRLSFLVGGLIWFLAMLILLRIRSATTSNDAAVDFDAVGLDNVAVILLGALAVPLAHALCHLAALLLAGVPFRFHRGLLYPHLRPARPVSRQVATRVLLAPLILSLVLFALMFVRPIGIAVAIWNAFNLAVSTNDLWKALGLRRFPPGATIEMNTNHCSLVERADG